MNEFFKASQIANMAERDGKFVEVLAVDDDTPMTANNMVRVHESFEAYLASKKEEAK